jgi:hypothetical protein
MSVLAEFRLFPRWLVLLVGFAVLLVTTTALLHHDDASSDDRDCVVCKAGSQPLTELSVNLIVEPPFPLVTSTPAYRVSLERAAILDAGSARAPPV